MQKKAAGKAEKTIDATAKDEAMTTVKPAKATPVKKATTAKVVAPAEPVKVKKAASVKLATPKVKESPRISLAALAMGTAAAPAVEEVPVIKPTAPAKVTKAAAAKPAPATKVAKPVPAVKAAAPASTAKPVKKTVTVATKSSPAASKEKPIRRVYKGIRLSPNLGPVHDPRVEVMVAPEPILVAAPATVVPVVEPVAAPKKVLLKRTPAPAPAVEVAPAVAPAMTPKKVLLKRRPTDSQTAPTPQATPVAPKPSRMAAAWAALRFPSAWVVATWAVLAVFMGSVAYSNLDEASPAAATPLAMQAPATAQSKGQSAAQTGQPAAQTSGIHHAVAYQAELTRSGVTGHYSYR
jgi:hypothetical protein